MEIIILILLICAVAFLVRIERHLSEVVRIQRAATTPTDVARRLQSEELEAVLFSRFIREDSSRSEMELQAQIAAFSKWKITNS